MNPDELTLYSRTLALAKRSGIPAEPGIYAWFFKEIPSGIPTEGCSYRDGLCLLYVGVASQLRRRIRSHFKGKASRSTLRRALGLHLGLELQYGVDNRLTFGAAGEQTLSEWMSENAFVGCWPTESPREHEARTISQLRPPLNVQYAAHPYAFVVEQMRREAQHLARQALDGHASPRRAGRVLQ